MEQALEVKALEPAEAWAFVVMKKLIFCLDKKIYLNIYSGLHP